MDWDGTSDGVPLYSASGRTLTQDERKEIAKKRGICFPCGIQTHQKIRFRRKALTNDDVYNGICIRCHPDEVPAEVLDAWNSRKNISPRSRRNIIRQQQQQQQQPSSTRQVPSPRPQQQRQAVSARQLPVTIRNIGTSSSARNLAPPSPHSNTLSPGRPALNQPAQRLVHSQRPLFDNASPSRQEQQQQQLTSLDSSTRGKSRRGLHSSSDSAMPLSCSIPNLEVAAAEAERMIDFSSQVKQYSLSELATACRNTNRNEPSSSERLILVLEAIKNFPSSIGRVADETRSLVIAVAGIIEQYRSITTTTTTTTTTAGSSSDPKSYNNAAVLTAAYGALWRINADDNHANDGEEEEQQQANNGVNDIDSREETKQIIVNSGICDVLVDTLRKHSAVEHATFVECAIGTLTSLAMHGCTMMSIARVDATEIVLEKLEQGGSNHAGILEWACRCLLALVRPVGSHRERSRLETDLAVQAEAVRNGATIEEGRGVPILIHAMKSHTTESQTVLWGMKLLCHLLESCSVDLKSQMVESGFVQLGEKILRARSTSGTLFAHTAELLVRLVDLDSNSGYVDLSDCVPSVVRVMDELNEDLEVQKAGCRLMASLKSECDMMGRGSVAIHAILAALKSRPDDLSLVETGCCALSRIIALNPSVMDDSSLADRATAILAELVEKHRNSRSLILSSCCCLRSLRKNFTADTRDPASIILQQATMLHSDDPVVIDKVVENLIALFEVDPDYCEQWFHSLELDDVVHLGHVTNELTIWKIYQLSAMVASRSDLVRETLLASGALPSAAAQLLNAEGEAFQTTLLNYIRLLTMTGPFREVDIPRGLMERLCGIVGDRSASEKVVQEGCLTLCSLIHVSVDTPPVDTIFMVVNSADSENAHTGEVVCNVFRALASKCPQASARNIEKMFRLCAEKLGKHSTEQAVYEGRLITSAAAALVHITEVIRTVNPIALNIADVDAVISSVYKIFENDSNGVVALADLLLVLENMYFVAPEILIEAGLIVVMIDVMAERENSSLVQERGCRLLSTLASEESLQINLSIVQTEGVDMLCAALSIFKDNVLVQSHACKTFAHLSVDEESKVLILLQGGLQLAAKAVKSHRDKKEVLKNAWLSLLRLTEGSHTMEDVIIETDVIPEAIATMKTYPHEKLLQEYCMGVLGNVSIVSTQLRQSIIDSGGIDEIIFCTKKWLGTPSTMERSLTALTIIIRSMEDNSSFQFNDAVNAVVMAMLALIDYDNVQARACASLEALAMVALSSMDKALMLRTGALEAVFYSMQAHYCSVTVQTTACRALAELTTMENNHSGYLRGSHAIVATETYVHCLLSAMRRFPGTEDIQTSACTVFRNFLLWPDNAEIINRSRGEVKSVLSKASSRYPILCKKPVNEAFSILRSLGV